MQNNTGQQDLHVTQAEAQRAHETIRAYLHQSGLLDNAGVKAALEATSQFLKDGSVPAVKESLIF